MPRHSAFTTCESCGSSTRVMSSHAQDDCARIRRHKCLNCGHIQFSAEVAINPNEVICRKYYQLDPHRLTQILAATF